MNKKSQGPPAAALKKGDHRKLKGSQSSVLCYNCGKEGHIHFNCPHLLKNNAYQIQIVKVPDINPASEYSKNLKRPQQSEASKGCHLSHKEWLFQLWSWFQKKAKSARLLLTAIQILILFIKVWWRSEESILLRSCRGTLLLSMKRNYLIMIYMISKCIHIIMIGEWMFTVGSSTLSRYQG